eukprot:TRINITY_DN4956_c1_g1_i1.p1 TRINITY_DN4956_c1_g1~~TRINITY_DN4956_c1_g1_i1.p1  ORF type:complete len:528 (-),score=67.58 TRINITY_DN4956_c1_g1_i1:170-1753(-)
MSDNYIYLPGSSALAMGSGLYWGSAGSLALKNCQVMRNLGYADGGSSSTAVIGTGVYAYLDSVSVINSQFLCNVAGIGNDGYASGAAGSFQFSTYGAITANVSDNSVGSYMSGLYYNPGLTWYGTPTDGITTSNSLQGRPVPFSANCGITAFPFLPPSQSPSPSSSGSALPSNSPSSSLSPSASPSTSLSSSPSSSMSRSASSSPSPSPLIAVQNVTFNPSFPQTSLTNTIGSVSDLTLMTFTLASNNSTVAQLLRNTTWTISKQQVNSSQPIQDGMNVVTSDGEPIDATTWHVSVGQVNVTTSVLYSSQTASANVSLGNSNTNGTSTNALLNYQLIPGSVKYTIAVTAGTSNLATIFPNGIQWNGCVNSSQNLGLYSTRWTTTQVGGQTYYTWKREQVSLRFAVPMQGLADNNVVNITHSLRSVTIDRQGLHVCFEWYFPRFEQSLLYDPTVETLFDAKSDFPDSDTSTESSDNSSSNLLLILEIVVPVAVGVAIVAALVMLSIGIAVVYLVRRHKMNRRRNTINF